MEAKSYAGVAVSDLAQSCAVTRLAKLAELEIPASGVCPKNGSSVEGQLTKKLTTLRPNCLTGVVPSPFSSLRV